VSHILRSNHLIFSLCIADHNFYPQGPLESPVWKMESEKEQKALRMFGHLNEWIELSNSEADSVRRDLKLKDIFQLTEKFLELKTELFLQPVKQSNGDPDTKRNMNLWTLFFRVADEIECPTVSPYSSPYSYLAV